MDFEELQARARASRPSGPEDPDRIRRDVLEFLASLPTPPLYRRRDDPARAAAQALLPRGEALLGQVHRAGEPMAGLEAALAAHVEALCLTAAGEVEQADRRWREGARLERAVVERSRLWERSDERVPEVFDPATRRSRFDPRPEPVFTTTLACPHCKKPGKYETKVAQAQTELFCLFCGRPFQVYVAQVRHVELRPLGMGRLHYTFRLSEASGRLARVEFDAPADGTLSAGPRELMAFLYAPSTRLRGALNLNVGRVLWLPTGCFLATAVYGEGAAQLEVLRRFRDVTLESSRPGRRLVTLYYRHGPALVPWVQARPRARRWLRGALDRLVRVLEAGGGDR